MVKKRITAKKEPKTQGLQWLEFSIIAFNGSGYADRESADHFLDSYIDYKKWKGKPDEAQLAVENYHTVLPLAEYLLDRVYATSHKPNAANYASFLNYRDLTNRLII
jgi:hypothetical protein